MITIDPLSILDGLNPEQQQAVSITQRHLRVLAGAGSGKTQVLVHRIAHLIQEEQLSTSQFLAVTFTNKAANEMRTRLTKLIHSHPYGLWVGTFHHLAHRILRQHYMAISLPKDFQIIDAADQQRRIKRIIQSMNLDEARFSPRQVQSFINQMKDNQYHTDNLSANSTDPYYKTLTRIYQAYKESCAQDHVLDFSDLLLRSYELLKQNDSILQSYQTQFRYILVDEFQDTSRMQYDWIRLLVGPTTYLTIVGDDDQSIYGWRGANIENMINFEQDFHDTQTIRLEQNYRSTETILSAANTLIAHNRQRLGKNLWTQSQSGEPIVIYEALSELDEARFIVEHIQKSTAAGIPYEKIALLYRSNAQSRILEEALVQVNLPYRIYGGLRFFERSEIKDVLAYLRLINHPNDNGAFDRIINTPPRGIGDKTLQTIYHTAQAADISYYEASHRLLSTQALPSRGANALSGALDLITQLSERIKNNPLDVQIEMVLEESGLLAYYQKETKEITQARLDNVKELSYAARQFASDNEGEAILSSFLNKMALETSEYRNSAANTQGVQLMTLHAAKGLEFPIVFLTGLEEGLFPSHLSLSKPSDVEEERRLCYVGITRAMQKLYLTYAKVRSYRGTETYRVPSRFIEELPKEHTSLIRSRFSVPEPHEKDSQPTNERSSICAKIGNTGFKLYQKVSHPSFGYGTITDYEGEGDYTRVQVKFDREGAKWLILQFAKLETVH